MRIRTVEYWINIIKNDRKCRRGPRNIKEEMNVRIAEFLCDYKHFPSKAA